MGGAHCLHTSFLEDVQQPPPSQGVGWKTASCHALFSPRPPSVSFCPTPPHKLGRLPGWDLTRVHPISAAPLPPPLCLCTYLYDMGKRRPGWHLFNPKASHPTGWRQGAGEKDCLGCNSGAPPPLEPPSVFQPSLWMSLPPPSVTRLLFLHDFGWFVQIYIKLQENHQCKLLGRVLSGCRPRRRVAHSVLCIGGEGGRLWGSGGQKVTRGNFASILPHPP